MAIGTPKVGTAAANASAATSIAVPYPSGLAANDAAILILFLNSADESSAVPSGWTDLISLDTGSNTSPTVRVYGRYLTGSESGSLTVATPNVTSHARMLALTGVDLTTMLDIAAQSFERAAANTTFPFGSFTPVTAGATIIVAAAQNTNTGSWTPPAGYTEAHDVATPTPKSTIAYLQGVGTTAQTPTVTSSTSTRGLAVAIVLRPAPDPVTGTGGGSGAAGTGAGAGTVTVGGAGGGTAAPGTAAGAGASGAVTGTGAAAGAPATGAGTGTVGVGGAGAATGPAGQAGGAGGVTIPGAGAAAGAPGTAAGTGDLTVTGTGAGAGAPGQGDGEADLEVEGTGDADAEPGEGAGAGTVTVTGTGAATATPGQGEGYAGAPPPVEGDGDVDAPAGEAAGAGTVTVAGTGAAQAPAGTGEGTGAATVSGTGAATGTPGTATGAGTATVGGDGTATAPAGTATGAGTTGPEPEPTVRDIVVRRLPESPPTTSRRPENMITARTTTPRFTFERTTTMSLYATDPDVAIEVEVTDREPGGLNDWTPVEITAVALDGTETTVPGEWQGDPGAVRLLQVALFGLDPGLYELQLVVPDGVDQDLGGVFLH